MKLRSASKKFFKILLVITGICALLLVLFFAPIDHEHYKEKDYYRKMSAALDSILPGNGAEGQLRAGWGKVNITPGFPLPLASYGLRNDFEKVHDSVWCRTFVFDNGHSRAAVVTLDLLIFPPVVVQKLKKELPAAGFSPDKVFLSTSHTHNGPGGWAPGLGGRFLAGKYSERYVDQLVAAVISSIQSAMSHMEEASVGFAKYEAKDFVFNRLSDAEVDVDHWLRVLKVKKKSGPSALLVTYAAHPTILSSHTDHISGDYAGALVDSLVRNEAIDFAAFSAGAVGGHRCRAAHGASYESIGVLASALSAKIISGFPSIPLKDSLEVQSLRIPLYLGEPQLKVWKGWKLRPWVFHFLLGKQELYLSALQLGDAVLIGTPADFSGELLKEIPSGTSELIITGFNGGYIGYIIPDKHYGLPRREAREMNWYGPYTGSYFTEIISKILRKI